MPFIIYNPDGSVASSGGQAGGGGGGTAKSYSPTWTYWTDGSAATMPTSFTNMNNPLVKWNGNGYATMGAGILVKSPGYISAVVGLVNGTTGGSNVYFQAYKNNNPISGLATPGQSSSSAAFNPSVSGGSSYTFAAGDLLSIWLKGDSSSINQSFSANLEWVFTG